MKTQHNTYTHIEHPEQLPASGFETAVLLFTPLIALAIVVVSVWMGVQWFGG